MLLAAKADPVRTTEPLGFSGDKRQSMRNGGTQAAVCCSCNKRTIQNSAARTTLLRVSLATHGLGTGAALA